MNEKIFSSSILDESYSLFTHKSGLDVYIYPKKVSTSFALFGTKFGSMDTVLTSDGKQYCVPDGTAHFLEHKLFAEEDGSDAFEHFSELGADSNAYTSFNRTAYHFTSSENFYESLYELVSFVTHPYFTEENIAAEVGIISEEIAMYDDSPSERVFLGMLEGMYRTHPVKINICGTEDSIKKITPEGLYQCYRNFYNPKNMVLIICADADIKIVFDILDAALPKDFCEKLTERKNFNLDEPRTVACQTVTSKMQVSKPLFEIGFKDTDIPSDPKERQKRESAMAIINEILFSRSGAFYASLVEQGLISPALNYGYTCSATFAYCSIGGEADNPELVLQRINEHIEQALDKGLDKDEFERAVRVMYSEAVRQFDSVESIGNLLFMHISEGTEIFSQAESFRLLTFEYVGEIFKSFFSDLNTTLSVIQPL